MHIDHVVAESYLVRAAAITVCYLLNLSAYPEIAVT